ncbi:hypothetical protein FHS56_000002 [Thermonema lapsum]|uniref:HTTM domain-containing protein n=1 Tax=Thermonema lapsum TaxID=28195 RepID=A0A846MLW1_9BACT|nr:hypothetical protein [Thermonema lapsum]NIK72516.1 hypothetical protein [Thermonema lapsum]
MVHKLQNQLETVVNFCWSSFYRKLVAHSFIPLPTSLNGERKKAAILRIAIGIVAWVRTLEVLWGEWVIQGGELLPHALLSVVIVGLLTCFIIGFMTAPTTVLLILLYRHFELKSATFTLGTDIFVNYLLLSLFVSSGAHYSLDGYLEKRCKWISKLNQAFLLIRTPRSLRAVYFLFFAYYALMSFSAILMHVTDDYWWSFISVKVALVNSYLCKYYAYFRLLDKDVPWLLGIISFLGVIFQGFFQMFMIPLIYFRWGSFYVKWHGVLFFVISLFFLNLSYLPWIELGLWGLIFFPWKEKSPKASDAFPGGGQENLWQKVLLTGTLLIYFLVLFPYMLASGLLYGKTYRRLTDAYWLQRSLELMTNRVSIWLAAHLGAVPPNVFNSQDLQMGECFFVLYRKDAQNKETMVPLVGQEGERLNYENFDFLFFMNHNSDVFYFGTTLIYRRAAQAISNEQWVSWHTQGLGWKLIERVISIDTGRAKALGSEVPKQYKVVLYRNASARSLKLWEYCPEAYVNHPAMELSIEVSEKETKLLNYRLLDSKLKNLN